MADNQPIDSILFTGASITYPVELLVAIVEFSLQCEDTKLSQKALDLVSSDKTTPAGVWKASQSADVSWSDLRADMLHVFGQQHVWTVEETLDLLFSLKKHESETIKQFLFRVQWVIQYVLDCSAKTSANGDVAQLWCQYAFLLGMDDEDRSEVLDNLNNWFEEGSLIESRIKLIESKSELHENDYFETTDNFESVQIKTEPEGYENDLQTDRFEQFDEDVVLSKARKKTGKTSKRNKSNKVEESQPERLLKIEDDWAKLDKEAPQHQTENGNVTENIDVVAKTVGVRKRNVKGGVDIEKDKTAKKKTKLGQSHKGSESETSGQVCKTCGKVFESLHKLTLHIRYNWPHRANCPKCPGVEFQSWAENLEHRKTVHSGVVYVKCRHCPEVMVNSKAVKQKHFKERHEENLKKCQCPDCGEVFTPDQFKYHKKWGHAPKDQTEFPCKECEEIFATRIELRRHVRKHWMTCCAQCGKSVRKETYKLHVLTRHTPEDKKPFVCPKCVPVKGFATKQNFEEHMHIHSGIKPFSCKLCPNASYSNSSNLQAHIRQVHQGRKRKPKSTQ